MDGYNPYSQANRKADARAMRARATGAAVASGQTGEGFRGAAITARNTNATMPNTMTTPCIDAHVQIATLPVRFRL